MEKKTKQVLDVLRPKVLALGFTKEELEGVAAIIANNLSLSEESSEEDVLQAVTNVVNAYLPILELGQKSANRIIQKNKEEREKLEAEARQKAEAEARAKEEAENKAREEAERKAKEEADRIAAEEAQRKEAEEAGFARFLDSDWAKNIVAENGKLAKQLKSQQEIAAKQQAEFQSFRDEFNAMKAERIQAHREKTLDEVLSGAGVFGERIKKNYAKMSFDSDEDFDRFIAGVKEDLQAFNQERSDEGLSKLSIPAVATTMQQQKVEPMTDAEIDDLASIF